MKFLITLLLIALAIIAAVYFTAEIALDRATSEFIKFISTDYPAGKYRATTSVLSGRVEVQPYGKDGQAMPEAVLLQPGDVKTVEGVIKSLFPGVDVIRASFNNVEYRPPVYITWKGISFDLKITNKRIARIGNYMSLTIDSISLEPEDLKERIVLVTMRGIKGDLRGARSGVKEKWRKTEVRELRTRMKFRSLDPQDMLQEVKGVLENLASAAQGGEK